MEDKLHIANELLSIDDKLSADERTELRGLLRYVMSNPKGELASGKWKLIGHKILKAAKPAREFVLDLSAKYLAELSK